MEYTKEEMLLIDQYKDLPKKQCKECEEYLPMHETFFLKEKRIKDGFENKCRKCRTGHFKIRSHKNTTPSRDKNLLNQNKSIYELYEYYLKENVLPFSSFILDNHIDLFKYLVTKENIKVNDLTNLNVINRQWFQDRKLYSSLLRVYNGSINEYVMAAYPNIYNVWEFELTTKNYWNNKENRVNALNWFVNKLIDDKVINNINEIPRKINGELFNQYSLYRLYEYYPSLFDIFNEVFPTKFYMWQFKYIPDGYFDNKNNRINAMKELVNDYLKINIKDIPRILSYEYFNRFYFTELFRFKYILDNYYNFCLYDYINEVYPNTFNVHELPYKNHYMTLDNVKVRSEPERMIHHLFIRNKLMFKYGDDIGRMNINGVNVLPDWYIYKDDKIILVEYYGMLDMNGVDFGYNDKYKQKEKLYNDLCIKDDKYKYLTLLNEDMNNVLTGVIKKLKEYELI